MANTVCFTALLSGAMTAYGHAMPCNLKGAICLTRVRAFLPFTEVLGITVPISRGGPPVLTE